MNESEKKRKACTICAGRGCYMCTVAPPTTTPPVYKEIEISQLIEVLQILGRAKNPCVTFYEDIERMRKEAVKISEVSLHNAIVILNDMVNR